MKTLEQIQQQLYNGEFEFSRHAFKRAIERNISVQEIRVAGQNAIIIETYPDDKYSPLTVRVYRNRQTATSASLNG